MTVERKRDYTAALVWPGLALGLFGVLALLLSGLGTRWDWWEFRTGFVLLRWGAYAGLGGVAASLIGLIARGWWGARLPWWLPALGLLLSVVAAAIPWRLQQTARAVPPIHDITTDTEDPPAFLALAPARAASPNGTAYGGRLVAVRQQTAYPDVRPLRLDVPPARALEAAGAAARELGWTIAALDPASGRLEATARTRWFGFYDDVVVRVTREGTGSRLDVRSASRVGLGDLGTNARRVRAFLALVKARSGR